MKQDNSVVNLLAPSTAPLKNVGLTSQLLQTAIERPPHLPGIVVLYGPSGYGKSFAAAYTATKHDAYYVECKSVWTTKSLLHNIIREMGIAPEATIAGMVDQVSEQLALSDRPLIIDEVDHIVKKRSIEVIRDIYEGSGAPILLIGEEKLSVKLRQWERFHNRVLQWLPAQPADRHDTQELARMYCHDIKIGSDVIDKIVQATRGITRRICVNLHNIKSAAKAEGWDQVTMKEWGRRELYTGEPPRRSAG